MASGEGSTFGKYFLLKKLALGGMGEIFLAKLKGPVGFEKLLVIKRILAHHIENQEFVDMFFAEARVAAKLSHSNVVQIYEMGEIEDSYYIAMEYVHGKTLREVIDCARSRGEYIPPGLVIHIISKLCDGLGYSHNASNISGESIGIIHRDINPQNLLISYTGEVKIIDFGIAKSEMSMHQTETGTIKGKFVYMSPEQSAAEPLDKRSDIFSVGICLYEALTLVNPFAKANVVLSLDAIQRKAATPVSQTNQKLAPFQPALDKALAKDREDRYADCSDLHDDLQQIRMSGEIEKPRQPLTDYMHEMFEETIEREKRMILETDSASTSQIQIMKEWLEREHQSGSHSGYRVGSGSGRVAAHASAVALAQPEPHSRLPFFFILLVIILVSGAGAGVVFKMVQNQRAGGNAGSLLTRLTSSGANAAPPASMIAGNPEKPRPDAVAAPSQEPPTTPATNVPDTSAKKTKSKLAVTGPVKERIPRRRGKRSLRSRNPPESKKPDRKPLSAPSPPPEATFGSVSISTNPPVKILRGGRPSGQTFKLKSASGTIHVGTGTDPTSDPFTVRVLYQVEGDDITYTVASDPWAIVKDKRGIGLGRTPLSARKGELVTVFEFINPQESRHLRVTVRFTR
ncbi:MAG: protein kinase [Myxococcota bacterium]